MPKTQCEIPIGIALTPLLEKEKPNRELVMLMCIEVRPGDPRPQLLPPGFTASCFACQVAISVAPAAPRDNPVYHVPGVMRVDRSHLRPGLWSGVAGAKSAG